MAHTKHRVPVSFYQDPWSCGLQDMPDHAASRASNVQDYYRTQIARWLCRRLPSYCNRVDEVLEQLLEEMPVEQLQSRTVLAEGTLGLVHVLRFSKYLKLGASHMELHRRKRHQSLAAKLQWYKRHYTSQDCRLESLPVIVICRTAAQALLLEGFLHRYMRRFCPQMVMSESDSNELYSLDAQDVLLQQLHWRAQRSASQGLDAVVRPAERRR
mmetsp:Transcript_27438/g.38559  ORF Transcript_27438/g.38559 Transcript_27438/m.38559 type:complete len:213 (+) Transcript_27438:149-787(+)